MGICVISVLLVVIPLFSSSPTRRVLPVPFQLQPSFKGYGDSPRRNVTSRLHMTEAPAAKFLLKRVEPEYPHEAKVAGVEGDVVFRIIIGTDGRVEEIHLRRGKPLFLEAAAKAVSKWHYKTFMLNGKAVEVETFATVQFRLPSKHQTEERDGVPAHSLVWSNTKHVSDPKMQRDDEYNQRRKNREHTSGETLKKD